MNMTVTRQSMLSLNFRTWMQFRTWMRLQNRNSLLSSMKEKAMDYEIIIPPATNQALLDHLLKDRSREQMAVLLCGLSRVKNCTRLLGRHLITMPSESFSHQSSVGLKLDQTVQRYVLQLAAREGLSQVDFHTHPGDGPSVGFSGIDDGNEMALAKYLAKKLPRTVYSSVVL